MPLNNKTNKQIYTYIVTATSSQKEVISEITLKLPQGALVTPEAKYILTNPVAYVTNEMLLTLPLMYFHMASQI